MWSATISAIEASTKIIIFTCEETLLTNNVLIGSFHPLMIIHYSKTRISSPN